MCTKTQNVTNLSFFGRSNKNDYGKENCVVHWTKYHIFLKMPRKFEIGVKLWERVTGTQIYAHDIYSVENNVFIIKS